MARWRLTNPHYLATTDTEWEYKETDRTTGRQARKVYQVPRYLNPEDPSDHNYPGEIIVSDGNGAQSKDIIFSGPPSAEMEPLDAAAEALSAEHAAKWKHPVNNFDINETLVNLFNQQGDAIVRKQGDELAELKKQNAALMAKIEAMTSGAAAQKSASTSPPIQRRA